MANTNVARGFIPVRYQTGAPYNGATSEYDVPASDGTALFPGDPVFMNGTASADGTPQCIKATAAGGAFISGVVVAVLPTTRESTTYRVASTLRRVLVCDDPNVEFEIQEDAVGGALAVTSTGLNADWIDGAGSTVTGQSGVQLDSSTAATTNTLQLRILGFVKREDNEIGNANAKMRVAINLHTKRNLTGL